MEMFTPPYVLLLIRTFLTLEGIAARVDPDFNIYEMAMPWAVRRSLSPMSADGIATMRSTLLTPDNRVQWDRVLELLPKTEEAAESDAPSPPPAAATLDAATAAEATAKRASNEAAQAEAMNDAVMSLLGSSEGAALRRALNDLDSTDLALKLVSREARALRQGAALAICGAFTAPWKAKMALQNAAAPSSISSVAVADGAVASQPAEARPVSEAALLLRERQARWKRKVAMVLVASHLRRQLTRGFAGARALASLVYVALRVVVGGALLALRDGAVGMLPKRLRPANDDDRPPALAA